MRPTRTSVSKVRGDADRKRLSDYLLALAKEGKHLADISTKPTSVEELLRLGKSGMPVG